MIDGASYTRAPSPRAHSLTPPRAHSLTPPPPLPLPGVVMVSHDARLILNTDCELFECAGACTRATGCRGSGHFYACTASVFFRVLYSLVFISFMYFSMYYFAVASYPLLHWQTGTASAIRARLTSTARRCWSASSTTTWSRSRAAGRTRPPRPPSSGVGYGGRGRGELFALFVDLCYLVMYWTYCTFP